MSYIFYFYTHVETFEVENQRILDGLELCRDDRQHRNINAVELVKAAPGTTLAQAREDLAHRLHNTHTQKVSSITKCPQNLLFDYYKKKKVKQSVRNATKTLPMQTQTKYTLKNILLVKFKKTLNLGICLAPTRPFRVGLDAESRVCYTGNTAECVTWVTQQTGNHNGRSRTANSRSQQQIRTKG
jgi:hypothetical protein